MRTANLLTSSAIGLRKVLHFIVIVIILNYRVLNYNLILKILPGKYMCTAVRKKGTRQSRKVLWVVFSSLYLKEISKNGTRGHGRMFASASGKQQK